MALADLLPNRRGATTSLREATWANNQSGLNPGLES